MRPLLVIPALFGTEIHDVVVVGRRIAARKAIWGTFGCLYRGPLLATPEGLRGKPGKVMTGIPLLAGLRYDILGALEKALCKAGYRTGETLHFFAYDWRFRSVDNAPALAAEVRRLAAASGSEVDLLGLSNGGLLVRAAFACDPSMPVDRAVMSGAPLGGSIESLACLNAGFQFAPLGRTVSPAEFIACPGALECLPGPDFSAFVDPAYDLYAVETWKQLRLSVLGRCREDEVEAWTRIVADRLASTRRSWEILQSAPAPKRLVCICGEGLPTQARIVVESGKARMPGEGRVSGLPAEALADGDGGVTLESARAWPSANPEVIRIPVGRHRDVVRTPPAFRAILNSLA